MSEPIHILIDLSPETIAALKGFLSSTEGDYRRPRVLRPPASPTIDIAPALVGVVAVTIPEVLDALGVEPEHRTQALATGVGRALRGLGWTIVGRRGGGARERVYGQLDKADATSVG